MHGKQLLLFCMLLWLERPKFGDLDIFRFLIGAINYFILRLHSNFKWSGRKRTNSHIKGDTKKMSGCLFVQLLSHFLSKFNALYGIFFIYPSTFWRLFYIFCIVNTFWDIFDSTSFVRNSTLRVWCSDLLLIFLSKLCQSSPNSLKSITNVLKTFI